MEISPELMNTIAVYGVRVIGVIILLFVARIVSM